MSSGLKQIFNRVVRRSTSASSSIKSASLTPATKTNNITTTSPAPAPTPAEKMAAIPKTADALFELVKQRRTYYALNKDLGSVTPDRIKELVNEATLHTPSSFNTQSNRILVLLGAEHDKFWDATTAILKGIVPEEAWQHTADRMAGFKAGAGSILFFDDDETIRGVQAQFPAYADKFPVFATQSLAMQQWILWTALELEGLGANLQHYSPLVDDKVVEYWGVPKDWKLNAQLVFGGRAGEPGEKTFKSLEERVKFAGL